MHSSYMASILTTQSGKTHGAIPDNVPRIVSQGTMIGNPDPKYDDCSLSAEDTFLVPYFPNPVPNASPPVAEMTGRNIGDLLNAKDNMGMVLSRIQTYTR